MTKRMLIDATHAEETRVVVLDGNRLEDFDVETSTKRQLKGNIYLAKVVRVEPSLQAAFVEYGGNRHGFLAFSEIHPDYYQIPVSDRQELLDEDARAHNDEDDEGRGQRRSRRHRRGERAEKRRGDDDDKLVDTRSAELETTPDEIANGETQNGEVSAEHQVALDSDAEHGFSTAFERSESDVTQPSHAEETGAAAAKST